MPGTVKGATVAGAPAAAMSESRSVKVVLIGDGAVGKTSLLTRYSSDEFNPEHEPTVFENTWLDRVIDGRRVELALWVRPSRVSWVLQPPFTSLLCRTMPARRSSTSCGFCPTKTRMRFWSCTQSTRWMPSTTSRRSGCPRSRSTAKACHCYVRACVPIYGSPF